MLLFLSFFMYVFHYVATPLFISAFLNVLFLYFFISPVRFLFVYFVISFVMPFVLSLFRSFVRFCFFMYVVRSLFL